MCGIFSIIAYIWHGLSLVCVRGRGAESKLSTGLYGYTLHNSKRQICLNVESVSMYWFNNIENQLFQSMSPLPVMLLVWFDQLI